jgi:hypothetical protein
LGKKQHDLLKVNTLINNISAKNKKTSLSKLVVFRKPNMKLNNIRSRFVKKFLQYFKSKRLNRVRFKNLKRFFNRSVSLNIIKYFSEFPSFFFNIKNIKSLLNLLYFKKRYSILKAIIKRRKQKLLLKFAKNKKSYLIKAKSLIKYLKISRFTFNRLRF